MEKNEVLLQAVLEVLENTGDLHLHREVIKKLCSTISEQKPPVNWQWEAIQMAAEGKKIAAIKHVRNFTELGLKEAKDWVENYTGKIHDLEFVRGNIISVCDNCKSLFHTFENDVSYQLYKQQFGNYSSEGYCSTCNDQTKFNYIFTIKGE